MRLDPEDNISINIEAKCDEKIEEHKSRRLLDQPHVGTLHTRVASQYSILSL